MWLCPLPRAASALSLIHIYGHHMKDGTMFKDIMKFREQEFLEEHQTAYIYLPDQEIELRPYACLYTDSSGIRRKTRFSSDEEFKQYTAQMTMNSDAYVPPEQEIGRLFSFVTVSYTHLVRGNCKLQGRRRNVQGSRRNG